MTLEIAAGPGKQTESVRVTSAEPVRDYNDSSHFCRKE